MKGSIDVVGLSISRCVRDIALGLIPIASVRKIIGGSAFPSLDEMWEEYGPECWADCAKEANRTLFTLYQENRIDQPRLRGETPPGSQAGIWTIGEVSLNTPELKDLLSISDYFLQLTQGKRNRVLEVLPPDVLEQFLHDSNSQRLQKLFPDLPQLVKKVPANTLYSMIVSRLKNFYQQADDMEQLLMHHHVMQILMPFLKHKMAQEKLQPCAPPPKSPLMSQIRVLGIKPPSATSGGPEE